MATSESKPFIYYGGENSYYSGKARPAFRIKRAFTEERLPTPAAYRVMKERTGQGFLPTVITPEDDVWQDTSEILDRLEARIPSRPSGTSCTPWSGTRRPAPTSRRSATA